MWAFLPVAMTVIGSVMGAAGAYKAGQAAKEAGERQAAEAAFEAAQLEQAAGQSIAAGQHNALDQERQGKLVASRMLAVSAASGAGTGDTVMRLISDVAGENAYRMGVALYQGEERARQQRMAAAAKLYEGESAKIGGQNKQEAYNIAAVGSLFKGAGSLFTQYGGGGFKSSASLDLANGPNDAGITGMGTFG